MEYGVSFSVKQCRNFGVLPADCLQWLMESGFKRFRLMSYWDECEAVQGTYDFEDLDQQIKFIAKQGGWVSLCLGAKQPRWPEEHWPDWAWNLLPADRTAALLKFVEMVIDRYKNEGAIISYQLENEALLRFGDRIDINRSRLRDEFALVRALDPKKPIAMSTSTSWGIPLRRPIPDLVGFSFYQVVYRADLKKYTTSFHKPWVDKLRALAIKILWRKKSFIHELQLEPWGPKNIWEMDFDEQMKSMSLEQIAKNLSMARQTGLKPYDLWGGEWWYWAKQKGHPEVAEAVLKIVK